MTETATNPRPRAWTKLDRVRITGWNGLTRKDSAHEHTCYLCNSKIPMGAFYLRGSIQVRAYRSVRDMGCNRAEVRICAACLFPATKEA